MTTVQQHNRIIQLETQLKLDLSKNINFTTARIQELTARIQVLFDKDSEKQVHGNGKNFFISKNDEMIERNVKALDKEMENKVKTQISKLDNKLEKKINSTDAELE